MNSVDCPPDTISPIGKKLGACAKPCIQEIFRPQNRGALAQAAPATSRAQDDLRLLRFHNGFCLQSDWSAIDARRAGERKLTRLQASPAMRCQVGTVRLSDPTASARGPSGQANPRGASQELRPSLPDRRTARTPSMKEPRNRVVQVRQFGGPDGLEVVDAPLPTAERGEVRVRVLASGLEYTDVLIRRHLYPQTMHRRLPFVMGYDVVGEIDQLGDGVQVGDRVADMTVIGSNAAYRTLRADHLTRVPAGVDPADAATLILSWTTAYQLLHRAARVQRGQRVLVHGAAGAVGQALLALGKMAGLEMWGAARGEHEQLIRAFGATPIDHQREDFTRVLPGGFDVI